MSIESIEAFHNEATVAVGDDLLHLVIDFRVIDLLEGLLQRSMDELVAEVLAPPQPHALVIKFVRAMARAKHPELTTEQVAAIMYGPHKDAVGATVGGLLQRAFNIGGGKEEGEQSRPPRKRSSGASRGSARSGSRRASNRTHSGEKRPARS